MKSFGLLLFNKFPLLFVKICNDIVSTETQEVN